MKYSSEIDKTNGICRVKVTGKFIRPDDSDELKHFALGIFTNNGCCRFLIALTEAEVVGGTMPTYDAANPTGEIANSLRRIKTAFVRRELSEDDRFYENVAVNRGFSLRAFDKCEIAVEWLTQR